MSDQWQNRFERLYDDQHRDGAIFVINVTAPSGAEFFKLARCRPMNDNPDRYYVSTKPFMVRREHRDSFLAALATYYNKVARIDTSTTVGAALNKAVKKAKGNGSAANAIKPVQPGKGHNATA